MLTCTAAASTVTCSVTCPSFISTRAVATWPTFTMTLCTTTVLNPVFVTVRLYTPGNASGKLKLPVSSAFADCFSPVLTDWSVTPAPGTFASDWSTTSPRTEPVLVWPTMVDGSEKATASRHAKPAWQNFRVRIIPCLLVVRYSSWARPSGPQNIFRE